MLNGIWNGIYMIFPLKQSSWRRTENILVNDVRELKTLASFSGKDANYENMYMFGWTKFSAN